LAGEVYRRIFGHRHVVVIQHHNLSTQDWLSIKKQHSQIKFKIINTYLIQKVLQESKFSNMIHLFEGPVVLAFSSGEISSLSSLVTFCQSEPRFLILGAKIDNSILTSKQLSNAVTLPPIKTLQSQLISLIQSSPQSLLATLSHTPATLSQVLQIHSTPKNQSS